MASRGSKLALAGTSLFAVTTIIFVHFQQQAEKSVCSCSSFLSYLEDSTIAIRGVLPLFYSPAANSCICHAQAMHQGVVRDMEQQRIKRERQLDFDLQRQLEAEYKQEQTVRSSIEAAQQQGGVKR